MLLTTRAARLPKTARIASCSRSREESGKVINRQGRVQVGLELRGPRLTAAVRVSWECPTRGPSENSNRESNPRDAAAARENRCELSRFPRYSSPSTPAPTRGQWSGTSGAASRRGSGFHDAAQLVGVAPDPLDHALTSDSGAIFAAVAASSRGRGSHFATPRTRPR
jgi:hypothetical protein